jgi:RNA polymerase sigma-70 factor (ECF subfamily)
VKDQRALEHSLSMAHTCFAGRLAEPDVVLDVGRLHDEYADFVWRSLQRVGVTKSNLEDALQDVFVVVQRRLHTYNASGKISTWLFGICLRVAAAHRRRAYVRREQSSPDLQNHPDVRVCADPEQIAMRHEAEQRLEQGLQAMELERRAVFVMFEIEGMPAGAIADILGIPVGTVYSRLHKARAEFSNAITRLEPGVASGGMR